MNKPTKSVATTGTFSSTKMPVAATLSSAKPKAKGKAAAAKKARPSEDSEEEQKIDMDEENDDLNVVLLEEVNQGRSLLLSESRAMPRRGVSMVNLHAS